MGTVPQRFERGGIAHQVTRRERRMLRIILRQSRFIQVRVFVDAGDSSPAMRDVVGAQCRYLTDLVGDVVTRVDESAVFLNGLEMLPGLLSQLFGQVLDEPRSARRVQNPADVRLFE